jgi:hypothetical protein
MQAMQTMQEGSLTYLRFCKLRVRVGTPAEPGDDYFISRISASYSISFSSKAIPTEPDLP